MRNRALDVSLLALIVGCLLVVACSAPGGQPRIVAPSYTTVGFTGSMRPQFQGGERIFIRPGDVRTAKVGDPIVWFEEARQLNILHGVIDTRWDGAVLVTKGTANAERDRHLVTQENFVGFVELIP